MGGERMGGENENLISWLTTQKSRVVSQNLEGQNSIKVSHAVARMQYLSHYFLPL